jgi:uncharacterized protein YukE
MSQDRLTYDTDVSAQVQGEIQSIVGRLESLIAERDKAVAAAMSDYQADGVSEEYQGVESRWKNAAGEVKEIIRLVRNTLEQNDQTAANTGARARAAVQNIG